MAFKKKGVNKKIVFAVILLAVIAVGVVAAVVYSNPKHTGGIGGVTVGVHVGDTFTYT